MAYAVELLSGVRVAARITDGPLPGFGDELVVEHPCGTERYRVIGVEHRIGVVVHGEASSSAVVIVEVEDGNPRSLGAAIRRARARG